MLAEQIYKNIKKKKTISEVEKKLFKQKIINNLKDKNKVLIAHYYAPKEIQELAEITNGFIGDSLEMAKFGVTSKAQNLIIAGVKFMGESAKTLSYKKNVYMLDLDATCSLDISCDAEKLEIFKNENPGRELVVYANTSAKVKAISDWIVTSSIAVELIEHLKAQNKKLIWAPDKHLGNYIKNKTKADMLIWDGFCIVHDEFKANALINLKKQHPKAQILVHPESPQVVLALANVIGSTSQLIQAATNSNANEFIVATEIGIFYKMEQLNPNKKFIIAPTGGKGAECRSCAHCPWMKLNDLKSLCELLEDLKNAPQIELTYDLAKKAKIPLDKMINFKNS